ncbi:MAG: homocysteine S-methyltransferase [Salinibacterium sp.]|nr:MAG: homocysteine S-methyltransferase [Salinibacterium sp.]
MASALAASPVVLDGGLGTLLERRGNDLSSKLWSAQMVVERPDEVRAAHAEYFAAGAQVAITASYQASYEGLAEAGLSRSAIDEVLRRTVQLAIDARAEASGERWIAASVGPYGAMLADGSEYRGDYGLSVDQLRQWHRPRLRTLADTEADVLAAETIPSLTEVEAIARELAGLGKPAWISVTVAFGALRSGEPLADAFEIAADADEVIGVGINCSDPLEVVGAIRAARAVTDKPVIVYPNSGEKWDSKNGRWMGEAGFPTWLVRAWIDERATLVGGCCRVGPAEIASIAAVVSDAR